MESPDTNIRLKLIVEALWYDDRTRNIRLSIKLVSMVPGKGAEENVKTKRVNEAIPVAALSGKIDATVNLTLSTRNENVVSDVALLFAI